MPVHFRWETGLSPADHAALAALLAVGFANGAAGFANRSWPVRYARKEAHLWLTADTGTGAVPGSDDSDSDSDSDSGEPIAHLAAGRRFVGTPGGDLVVCGIGDVATHPRYRGAGLGVALMAHLRPLLTGPLACDFGFVQTGEDLTGFYTRAGWTRVTNPMRQVSTADGLSVVDPGWAALILPGRRPVTEWPDGPVDLRGLPW